MESIKEIVCKNCARLLDRSKNLSEIARLMEISPTTISKWKSGLHAPELEKIDKLAKILGVDPEEFFKREDRQAEVIQLSVNDAIERFQSIPPDIYELAVKYGHDKKVWNQVRVVFDVAKERLEEEESKASRSRSSLA